MFLKSIKIQAIIIISIIISLSFVSLGLYNYSISKKMIHNDIINSSLPLLRDNIYSDIKRFFQPALLVSSAMANDSFLINWILEGEKDPEEIVDFLKNIKAKYNYMITFFVSESSGYFYLDNEIGTLPGKNLWYKDFIISEREYTIDIDTNQHNKNQETLFINYRVEDFQGNLLGVTGVGLNHQKLSLHLQVLQDKYDRKIYLIDKNEVIQADSQTLGLKTNTTYPSHDILESLTSSTEESALGSYIDNNQTIAVSSKYISEIGWYLIVEFNESSALAVTNRNLIRTLIVGFILLIIILTLVIFVLNYFSTKLEYLASTDSLTGCYNRRECNKALERLIDKKRRSDSHLSIVMIDVDSFKQVNDTMGHPFGDYVLKSITELISKTIRPSDFLGRLGGDEFVIIIENSIENTIILTDRIKQQIMNHVFENKKKKGMKITLSMGGYEAQPNDTIETITSNSDKALYMAKDSGKNCAKVLN